MVITLVNPLEREEKFSTPRCVVNELPLIDTIRIDHFFALLPEISQKLISFRSRRTQSVEFFNDNSSSSESDSDFSSSESDEEPEVKQARKAFRRAAKTIQTKQDLINKYVLGEQFMCFTRSLVAQMASLRVPSTAIVSLSGDPEEENSNHQNQNASNTTERLHISVPSRRCDTKSTILIWDQGNELPYDTASAGNSGKPILSQEIAFKTAFLVEDDAPKCERLFETEAHLLQRLRSSHRFCDIQLAARRCEQVEATIPGVGRVKFPLDACVLGLRKLGPSLRGPKLTYGVALQVGAQLIEALRELHEIKYVHTGIKPENICWRKEAFTLEDGPPAARDVDIVLLDLERAEPYMKKKEQVKGVPAPNVASCSSNSSTDSCSSNSSTDSCSSSSSSESEAASEEDTTNGDNEWVHVRNERQKSPVFGDRTGMFMSARLFRSSTVCRGDDLEAVYWTLLELVLGELPWDEDCCRREWEHGPRARPSSSPPRSRSPSRSSFRSLSRASWRSSSFTSRSSSSSEQFQTSSARRAFIRRMKRYLTEVRSLQFYAEPDYDLLLRILQGPLEANADNRRSSCKY
eukprot:g16214.t1